MLFIASLFAKNPRQVQKKDASFIRMGGSSGGGARPGPGPSGGGFRPGSNIRGLPRGNRGGITRLPMGGGG